MKLSVIIPAYNEAKLITQCVQSAFAALGAHAAPDWTSEVIVTDNNSTDETAALAQAAGARTVFEPINQISRARNAGAAVASGDWFLFIDADSVLHPTTMAELLHRIRQGRVVGGGCRVTLDVIPGYFVPFIWLVNFGMRLFRFAAGSFVFSRADAFRAIGGFSTQLYAAEEVAFSHALKRWGEPRGLEFAMLTRQPHVSSGRKLYSHGPAEMARLFGRAIFRLRGTLQDPSQLGIFYDGRR